MLSYIYIRRCVWTPHPPLRARSPRAVAALGKQTHTKFVCVRNALVRSGYDAQSPKLGVVQAGDIVRVRETRTSLNGQRRIRFQFATKVAEDFFKKVDTDGSSSIGREEMAALGEHFNRTFTGAPHTTARMTSRQLSRTRGELSTRDPSTRSLRVIGANCLGQSYPVEHAVDCAALCTVRCLRCPV